jgi:hypothetical protein
MEMEREAMETELEILGEEYSRLSLRFDGNWWSGEELRQLKADINRLRIILGYRIEVFRAITANGGGHG